MSAAHTKDRQGNGHNPGDEGSTAYEEYYNHAPVGYLMLDECSRILDANTTASELLGIASREDLKGRHFSDFVHAESRHAWNLHRLYLVERHARHGTDLALQRPDQAIFIVRVECAPRPEAGQCLMVLMDITRRVQTEDIYRRSEQELALLNLDLEKRVMLRSAELRESEERFRKLFEEAPDAGFLVDLDGFILDGNRAAESLTGYLRSEFIGLNAFESGLIAPESEEAALERHERHARGEKSDPIELFLLHKNGSTIPVEVTSMFIHLQGQPVILSSARDLTFRNQTLQKLLKSQTELRHLASELSLAEQRERQRIAGELHDGICQLLSSCTIRLGVVCEQQLPAQSIESIERVIGIISESLKQTRSLIFELSCPMLDELGLAAALEELCSSMTHEHAASFAFRGDMEPLPLPIDQQTVLYRATRELLINVTRHSAARTAGVELERVPDRVSIRVEDDGRGFDASSAGMGFSPSGGFGLFNLAEYLRHAGGEMSIDSDPGRGTRVTLSVPLKETHE